jgi:hypothetical protein
VDISEILSANKKILSNLFTFHQVIRQLSVQITNWVTKTQFTKLLSSDCSLAIGNFKVIESDSDIATSTHNNPSTPVACDICN